MLYKTLKEKLWKIANENNLLEQEIHIKGKVLSPEEAIGSPDRRDYPLLKGKERLLQADFNTEIGQAFTDMPGDFSGKLHEIIQRPLNNNYDRAVFIATLNAVLKHLGIIEKTIHCKGNEPEMCADEMVQFIKNNYGEPKIALVGYQPSFIEHLASCFEVRVLDLDADRINSIKYGIEVEDGKKAQINVLNWCDIIVATGSTIANGTITPFIKSSKPVIFYGTTIAGAANLMGLERFCACAK